jgi:hypothetical protein
VVRDELPAYRASEAKSAGGAPAFPTTAGGFRDADSLTLSARVPSHVHTLMAETERARLVSGETPETSTPAIRLMRGEGFQADWEIRLGS